MRAILQIPDAADAAIVSQLVTELHLPRPIAAILAQRGYDSPSRAKAFLRPRLADLHDPSSMPGIATAVDRLSAAIDAGDLILVHGDYDVDGVCSSAMVVRAVRELGGRAEAVVPHRL